jgi:transcriptional regulator with XRE-family HTH domain
MPRLRQPPDAELELRISARFRELRDLCRLSQRALADKLGMTRSQLANIEAARSPLRYREARVALNAAGDDPDHQPANPLWLAGETEWPIELDWPFFLPDLQSLNLPASLRFSEFIASHRPLLNALTKEAPEPALPEAWLTPYFQHWARTISRAQRSGRAAGLVDDVLALSAKRLAPTSPAIASLLRRYQACRARIPDAFFAGKKDVDTVTESANLVSVKSPLANLLKRLNRATAARGKKAELAAFLKVPRPCVTDWLSGKREPGGETTLRLLYWVGEQEAQQEIRPGSATTLPEPKTQSKASNEKKPKSGR